MRLFLARHLYTYLAAVAAGVVLLGVLFAREELSAAARDFDRAWVLPVLGLTLAGYLLRFLKWETLLRDSEIRVPAADNALLYFACFSMVITPARLGELYKLVFLRRLHGIPARHSLPALVMERVTDALAVLCLAAVQPFAPAWRVPVLVAAFGLVLAIAGLVAHERGLPLWRGAIRRIPGLGARAARAEELLVHHAHLLAPRRLWRSLALSVVAWGCECLGLALIVRALGASLPLGEATWIYAVATLVGNLTFLPGGLGTTELSLAGLLRSRGLATEIVVGSTVIVRAATLWFAVALGLAVSLFGRRRLQWTAVREEAAREAEGAGAVGG